MKMIIPFVINRFEFGLAVGAFLLIATGNASAEIIVLDVVMDQGQVEEVVVPIAGGNGLGTVIVNTDTKEVSWLIVYENLSGEAVGAHFHGPASRGEGSGIALDIGPIDDLRNILSGSVILEREQIDELLGGLWYVNLHTALNPPGEIRGQIED